MEKYKVLVDELAVEELIRHIAFLANKSPKSSSELYADIFSIIETLETMPERFAVYPTPYSSHIHRMAIHKYYLILYRVDEETSTVYVRRILDGRANNHI